MSADVRQKLAAHKKPLITAVITDSETTSANSELTDSKSDKKSKNKDCLMIVTAITIVNYNKLKKHFINTVTELKTNELTNCTLHQKIKKVHVSFN